MKKLNIVILSFVLMSFLFGLIGISDVEAASWPYRNGTRCWKVVSGDETSYFKLNISRIGPGSYVYSGKAYARKWRGMTNWGIVHGNAEKTRRYVLMTMVGSMKDPGDEMGTFIGHVVLSSSTLRGRLDLINHQFDYPTRSLFSDYGSAILTPVSCR